MEITSIFLHWMCHVRMEITTRFGSSKWLSYPPFARCMRPIRINITHIFFTVGVISKWKLHKALAVHKVYVISCHADGRGLEQENVMSAISDLNAP